MYDSFKAYIRTSLAPIVDAALYLATDNHYYCTRPAWIAILPTHLNYLHPPARETVAKARAATLDLSSADFDDRPEARSATRFQTVHQRYEHAKRMASQFGVGGSDGTEAAAPASSTLAGLERQGAASRLDWLLDTCFATLESVYGEDWEGLLDDEGPSSLDCLLLGYLSLLAYPAFRNTRIQDVLKGRHASLYTHTKDMRDRYLGSGYIAADDALRPSTGRSPAQPSKKEGLPWKRAASGPAWAGAFAATMNISSSVIPGLSAVMLRYRQNALLADSSPKDAGAEEGYFSLSNVGKAALTCSSLGLLGWGAYWLFVFHRQLRDREHLFLAARSVRLSTFGAVGAAFALFGSGAGHLAGGNGGRLGGLQPPEQDGPQAVIAEVTAEVDG